MESDSAMDLSLSRGSTSPPGRSTAVPIVRPTPRPPWSIVWYQNLWSLTTSNNNNNNNNGDDNNNNNNNSNIGGAHSFSVLNCLNTNQTANAFIPPHHQPEEHHHNHSHSYVRFSNENRPYYQCTTPPTHTSPSPQSILDKQHCGVIGPTFATSNQSEECYGKIKDAQDQRDSDNLENMIASPTPCSSDSSKSIPKSTGFSIPTAAALLESHQHQTTVIVDIACCDGPVQFKRISNPNFALTVEHRSEVVPDSPTSSISNNTNKTTTSSNTSLVSPQSGQSQNSGDDAPDTCQAQSPTRHSVSQRRSTVSGSTSGGTVTALKTYLCIYCNQSFKSLFCYQKHKKRHLNPVSVDITTTTANNSTSQRTSASAATSSGNGGGGHQLHHNNANNHNKNNNTSSNCSVPTVGGVSSGGGSSVVIGIVPDITKAKTKDLNVQFFPCKKCGCKFPSYYFVHKHRKICH